MSNIDDGGPAFPNTPDMMQSANLGFDGAGMSLRDWFAGQAISTLINKCEDSYGAWTPSNVAAGCYAVADAMIAARNDRKVI